MSTHILAPTKWASSCLCKSGRADTVRPAEPGYAVLTFGCHQAIHEGMTERDKLLEEIATFLRATGMAPTIFGREAVGDTALVSRMKAGRNITLATVDRIRKYMAEHAPASAKVKRPRPTSGAGRAKRAA